MGDAQPKHIAIMPSPGVSHLIPLAEFARLLVLRHNFSVTVISLSADSSNKAQKAVLEALPKTINSIELPPVSFDGDAKIETRFILTLIRSLPFLRQALTAMTSEVPISAIVIDLFGTDVFDIANEFGVPAYIFFPASAMSLAFFTHLPTLDATFSGAYRALPEPLRLPGCIPLHGKDFLEPVQDRNNQEYGWLLHQINRYKEAKGIIVNTFEALEPGALKALKEEGERNKVPVYPVGPLIQTGSGEGGKDGSDCLRWLDDQPRGSVLFVSFGSGGTLSVGQLNELALGLEKSEQRFLWVVRSPHDKVANANYLNAERCKDPSDFLPEGFLTRTKGVGFVVPSWAPQVQVLSHGSTGGFLTHCGWNSVLESIVHGVPLIAWPLYAEQKMNAVMLVEDMKVALKPQWDENGLVGREDISKVVQGLLGGEQGKRLQSKMRELKDAAAAALGDGGSSSKSLSEVATVLKNS